MSEQVLCACTLCDGQVIATGSRHESAHCKVCGQEHAYDEGMAIVLSNEQKALLLDAKPRVITRVMDDTIKTRDGLS